MADDGASPSELLIEASRRNNTDLLQEILSDIRSTPSKATSILKTAPKNKTNAQAQPLRVAEAEDDDEPDEATSAIAQLINTTSTPTGLTPLHLAARSAAYEALDILLDQDLVECDPRGRSTLATPLHSAIEHCNEDQDPQDWDREGAFAHVEILLDAGCDPRIRDKSGRRPELCVDVRNVGLKEMLQRAAVTRQAQEDAERDATRGMMGGDVVNEDEGYDDGGTPSDSE